MERRYLNENSVEFIDEMVKRWGRVVVPFFSSGENSRAGANGFGTGFLVRFNSKHYLVTAMHVVEDALGCSACAINICGVGVGLKDIFFYRDKENDLAVADLDEFLVNNGFDSIPSIDLDNEHTSFKPLGFYLLMGYPGTKNKLEPRWGKINRNLYSITTEKLGSNIGINTDIGVPILFEYDPKNQIDSNLKSAGRPPELYGMSGGPALELHAKYISEDELRFYVRLTGILVEWHKRKKIIVAVCKNKLIDLIERLEELRIKK